MADPLCRWRNFTPETICEIVKSLPKDVMPINAFRSYMANSIWTSDFFRTAYQYACQLALYYEDKQAGLFIPRFNKDITPPNLSPPSTPPLSLLPISNFSPPCAPSRLFCLRVSAVRVKAEL